MYLKALESAFGTERGTSDAPKSLMGLGPDPQIGLFCVCALSKKIKMCIKLDLRFHYY